MRPHPRPLVGINMDYAHRPSGEKRLALNLCYIRAVEAAGGIPVLLPWMAPRTLSTLLPRLDRLVLVGSDDLDPTLYGQKRRPEVLLLDPQRQAFDLELIARAGKRGLPILAICGGCQALNVARGGSLIQHIPAQVPGALEHAGGKIWHRVRVEKGSRLGRCLLGRSSLQTNSYHHQAVDRLGRGLKAVAWSSDGVVEGIEDPDHPYLLGVQWHPERCWKEKPAHGALFRALCKS